MEDPHQSIREEWITKTDWYVNKSKSTLVTGAILESFIHLLDLKNASSVLEVGCGSGNGIPIILGNSNETTQLTATDLTPSMVEIARSANNPRTTVLEANNEFLPFEDESFDRYIANMSLMIVDNPENMLKEAFRVLKSGSICGLSVWGSREQSSLFTLTGKVMGELGIQVESTGRSNFHLNDKDKLRTLFSEAGFSRIHMFENVHPYPCIDTDEMLEFYKSTASVRALEGTDDYERVCSAVKAEIQRIFDEGNLITISTVITIASK